MKYLLDTNVIVGLPKQLPSLRRRVHRHHPEDIGLSAIVLHELYFGAHKGRRVAENVAAIDELNFTIVDFTAEDARTAGEIRASLAARGTPIGPLDVLIAGQALARDLMLVTHNIRAFSRVDGLRVEDWET